MFLLQKQVGQAFEDVNNKNFRILVRVLKTNGFLFRNYRFHFCTAILILSEQFVVMIKKLRTAGVVRIIRSYIYFLSVDMKTRIRILNVNWFL